MKIYVADLAEYNAGNLYGKWLDLDDFNDADELKDAVYSVPKINPYSDGKERNEFAVHDYDLDFTPDPKFGEYPDLDDRTHTTESMKTIQTWRNRWSMKGCSGKSPNPSPAT